jgi:hypothetical protein
MKRTPSTLLTLTLALTALTAAGCSDDAETPAEGTAQLRVVHASPDAPAVDVYARGSATPLFRNVQPGDVTTYGSLAAGSYVIELRAAGSPAGAAAAFTTGELALTDGARVTAVAAGRLGSTAEADRFRVLPLAEGWDAVPAGKARVRVVHASADAPAVGIDVGDDGTVEVASLERWADTGAAGVELPAGVALQLGIRAGAARVTAFTTPALPAGGELFVIATGLLAERPSAATGFALLAAGSTGKIGLVRQNPVVHALHASPDAPAVDLFAGGAELADDLAFAELSGSIQVPPGAYTIDFFAHQAGATRPAGAPAASVRTPELAAGERYLAIATGFLGASGSEQPFQLLAYGEAFLRSASAARLRVVHASPDAPMVDIGAGAPFSAIFRDVKFGDASPGEGVEVAAGPLTVGVAPAGTTAPVARFALAPVAQQQIFAVAVGALAPSSGRQGFRLVAIDTSTWPWTGAAVLPSS